MDGVGCILLEGTARLKECLWFCFKWKEWTMCHWRYRGPLEAVEPKARTKVRKKVVKMQVRGPTLQRMGGISSSETRKKVEYNMFFFTVY